MRSLSLICLCAAMSGAALAGTRHQSVTLRLNPPAGSTYVYGMTMNTTTKVAGTASGMTNQSTVHVKVVSNSGGKIKLSSTISDVKITTPPGSPLAGQTGAMKATMEGKTTVSTLDSMGRPLGIDTNAGNPMVQSMMNNMGSSMGSTVYLPKDPVSVGSTWSSSMDLGAMMGAIAKGANVSNGKIALLFKLKSITNVGGKRIASIEMTMKGNPKLSMPSNPQRPTAGTMSMAFSSVGTIMVDVKTGMTYGMTSVTTTSMTFGTQGMTMNMNMSMRQK